MAQQSPKTLVTGASSGIGKALSQMLCQRGHDVMGIARRADRLRALEACQPGFTGRVVDLAASTERSALIETYLTEVGVPDYLILNAGVAHYGDLTCIRRQQVEMQVEVNILSVLSMVHGFLPAMLKRNRGRIIIISSVLGLGAIPYASSYVATKFAVNGFIRALRMDLKGTGVSASAMCPAGVATEFNRVATGDDENQRSGQEPVERVVAGIYKHLDRDKAVVYPTMQARLSAWILSQGWLMEWMLGEWQRDRFAKMLPKDRTQPKAS